MSAVVFSAVRTEGGLLPVDLLRRVSLVDAELPGMRGEDYGLAPGERLADTIVRSWNRLLPIWDRFAAKLAALPEAETTAEGQTRDQWSKWLLEELGFTRLEAARPVVIDEKPYPVSHRFEGVALHLVGARVDLDHRPKLGGRAPHSMVQEFLNRDDDYLWSLICSGTHLRILRDSSSLTRQAYCEFDVEAIFAGQLYSEFALLWLTCHASRFAGEKQTSCWLQQWSDTAQSEGVRALEDLRSGVEAAIEALGSGLLTPANAELRQRLRSGDLSTADFQRQLLRLVYRLLFLLVAESRDLLHSPDATAEQQERYRTSYSIGRLVTLARRQRGSLHHDLWSGLQVTFAALAGPGAAPLGLVGLGSFLWSPTSLPDVGDAVIPNRALLDAIDKLTSFHSDGVWRRVDYKNLGSEELGGVYESLLESHVEVNVDEQTVTLATAAGNERKTTGSYYTPSSLIRVLLDSALDPVLDEAEQADDPEAALLSLKVLDPAVGSGHFLIAATNRIAHRLAAVRSGDVEPSPAELRHALRDVIGSCVYGIDVNPMSVELCKVSLWMEATEAGKPLSFLDHHIVCGNSLLGATPAFIEAGVPDDAFPTGKPLTGDDKAVVKSLKTRNKAEREGQGVLTFDTPLTADVDTLADGLAAIDALPEDTAEQIAEKEQRYRDLQSSTEAERLRVAADAWCAAFVNPKTKGEPQITTDTVRRAQQDLARLTTDERTRIEELREQYRFLHLHVAFPDVFHLPHDGQPPENELCGWSGGFDAVLGNPPWERVKLQEKEWFAARDPEIAAAPNAAARKRMIAALVDEQPELHAAFAADVRRAEGESLLLRKSGRYPLGGHGDVNTYAVFAELMRNAMNPTGRVGVVVPTGLATDDTTKHFFADLVDRHSLVSLYDFENRRAIFPGIHRSTKFCLLTLAGDARPAAGAEFVFFALGVDDLEDPERRFSLTPDDFSLLNPNTRTCPIFRSKRDADLTKEIYRRVPILIPDGLPSSPWGVSFQRMFDMSNDSSLFRSHDQLESEGWSLQGNTFVKDARRFLPLFEAKMTALFDHRAADVVLSATAVVRQGQPSALNDKDHASPSRVPQPRYWVDGCAVNDLLPDQSHTVILRDLTSPTNERSVISCVGPLAGVGNSAYVVKTRHGPRGDLLLNSILSSFVLDYAARQKLGGIHLNYFVLNQLPIVAPEQIPPSTERLLAALSLELTYTAWDLYPFAASLNQKGPPFRWDAGRRELVRIELDAAAFRLFGLHHRDDVVHILNTFPIVRRKEESTFGEFRTQRLILERYDAMADAEAAGVEYQSILDPPPAHPSLCHPESTRPDWAKVD